MLSLPQSLSLPIYIAFTLQFIGWVLASRLKTSKFYDLFGSITFLTVVLSLPEPSHVSALMVIVWCCRLGTFLFYRALKHGEDARFESMLDDPLKFAVAWFLQGVWVVICLLPVILRAHRPPSPPTETSTDAPHPISTTSIALFVAGFGLEVVADAQKWAFKSNPTNAKQRMQTGVWSVVRYPNYAGEIILWIGIALAATTDATDERLSSRLALSLLSPVFVAFLLIFVSGIPPQESRQHEYDRTGRADGRAKLLPYIY